MVALAAVRQAGAGVASDPVRPLTAAELAALPISLASPTTTLGLDAIDTTSSPTAVPRTTAVTTAPANTVPPTTSPPAPEPTTTSPPTTSVGEGLSVYALIGGSAAIETTSDAVRLLWATPQSGYTVTVDAEGPEDVKVKFKSTTHISEFHAIWTDHGLDVTEREKDV